jgi:hypothetical protein
MHASPGIVLDVLRNDTIDDHKLTVVLPECARHGSRSKA